MQNDISFGIHVFCEGKNRRAYEMLGLHKTVKDGKECMVMRTWAPFARAVSLVGEFSGWKDDKYKMHRIDGGIWEVYTDCVFDISSAMMFMEQGEAERYINGYGAERMAYGTDYPLWDPVEEVQRFLSLKLSDRQFDQIAHKTAERILKLK